MAIYIFQELIQHNLNNTPIQVRTATVIKEDGVELTRSFHRHVVQCTDDISGQSTEVQAIGNAVWTDELKAAYQEFLDSSALPVSE